jgi:hypothetical protein
MMLISPAEWESILQRAKLPAFAAAVQRLAREVAAFLAQPLAAPAEPGGYYHDYFCPHHGRELVFDPASPHHHRCPVDNQVWEGPRFDAAWRWFVNHHLAEGAIRLAVSWRLSGNPACLRRVGQILSDYAGHYPGYRQIVRDTPNPGVATYTTLDEAVWVLPLTWAFDLVRDGLDAAQQEQIAGQLLVPVAEHLVDHHFRAIHNFACWHNAAIGTVGVVCYRPDLLGFAVHGEYGYERQLREGVLADGLWFEGSFSYHFYTLAALLALVKATRHEPGYDLHDRPALRAMLLAPIQAAYPDWSLPAPNDCWYFSSLLADCCHGVPPAPAFYEVGYAWYGDPRFAHLLQQAYTETPRETLDALLFGATELPTTPATAQGSVHLAASGYAILRTPPADANGQQRYLLLKHGPHGGGHGHPDKLNLILYDHGQRFSADLGTPGYGLDLFESWYRQTVSHNTVTLDGRSQPPACGQIHRFDGDGPVQVADASITWPDNESDNESDDVSDDASIEPAADCYRGVTMRRIILARPDYFLDIFLVDAGQSRRIDWVYHNMGRATMTLEGQPVLLDDKFADGGEGYQHLDQIVRATAQDDFSVTWQMAAGGLRLWVAGTGDAQVLLGQSPGNPPDERRSTLIQRRTAQTTVFLSLFHPYADAPQVTHVEWIGRHLEVEGWAGCIVQCAGHREQWLIRRPGDWPIPEEAGANSADFCFEYTLDEEPT